MDELFNLQPKPCPFCGSDDVVIYYVENSTGDLYKGKYYPYVYGIECKGCGNVLFGLSEDDSAIPFTSAEGAVEAWNRRA